MNDDERDIRAILHAEATDAPRPAGIRAATVRRARLRRSGVVALSLAGSMLVFGGALAGVSALDADVVTPPPGPEATPDAGSSGRIAFTRFAPDGGIFVMDADGGDVHRVVDGDYHALDEPAWSPDGSRIAFHGFFGEAANEAGGLFVMNADGSDRRLLALGGGAPTWSPDGHHIAFTRDGGLYTIATDSGRTRHLAPDVEVEFPDWSPDGHEIVFSHAGISVMSRDGYSVEPVAPGVIDHRSVHPVWSPDGTQIAFTRYEGSSPDGTIDVVSSDGSGHRSITRGRSPAWSPDGTRIAFARRDGDVSHIYSTAVDGSDLRQLTFGPDSDHSPDWTADGGEGAYPKCGRTNIASDEYGTEIDPTTGPPGTEVTLSGTTVRGEDWRWAPSDRLEAWWNTDLPVAHGRPIADGPVLRLVRVDDMERCRFEATFTVPDVEPGRYRISVFAWDADPSEGYGWFLPHHFAVTDDG